jgi:hypothetical protein
MQKSHTEIRVSDGAGGMRSVVDLRFAETSWPIELTIPSKNAESWMANVRAEMEKRGWNSSGLSQLEAAESSGTHSIYTANGPSPPMLQLIWERPRDGTLRVRARPDGTPTMPLQLAENFIGAVNERVRARVMDRAHKWELLTYQGLPWRGELWLTDDLRLGPPSLFPNSLNGPQIVIVDAMVDGIGSAGITTNFQACIAHVRIFLAIALGMHTTPVRLEDGWVAEFDDERHPIACSLRSVGYWEIGPPRAFPTRGVHPPVTHEHVQRPGLGRSGIWPDMKDRWVPSDIEDLWKTFHGLPPSKREQLLQAGNAYLIANSMWPDQRTAYAVFLVVACEALKPTGKRHDRLNVYDIVASLVSIADAQHLRGLSVHPQKVRNQHVHRGKLAANELLPMFMNDDFRDPSFDEMLTDLTKLCRTCLVEWLRCKGAYRVVRLPRDKPNWYRSAFRFIAQTLLRFGRAR